jgi:hypothetical protein
MTGKMALSAVLCLAVMALAGAGPAGVKAEQSQAGVLVCQRSSILCVVRCRTIMVRRRCQPAATCSFNDYSWCRCYYQGGACRLRCKARRVQRPCDRSGWCQALIRRCRCGGRMVPPGPPHR